MLQASLDTATIQNLSKRAHAPHIFAPLGNEAYFLSLGIPQEHVHVLDWWESQRVEVDLGQAADASAGAPAPAQARFDVTCTPAQHVSGRGVLDRCKTLWASWVVQAVAPAGEREGVKVYFAGDTGYRTVRAGEDEAAVPTCPAFQEIGARWGGFDFAMIPIGYAPFGLSHLTTAHTGLRRAYLPRDPMSPVHCAPQDSVRVFQDVRAKRALGMHWGCGRRLHFFFRAVADWTGLCSAWVLTMEDVVEPPRRLAEECKKAGIEEGSFEVCGIGETLFF